MSNRVLKTVVFMGSAKNVAPPWGGPVRLCDGVTNWVVNTLKARTATVGSDTVTYEVTTFDPCEVFGEGGALEVFLIHLSFPHLSSTFACSLPLHNLYQLTHQLAYLSIYLPIYLTTYSQIYLTAYLPTY